MFKTLVTRVVPLSLCLLPACGVSPVRSVSMTSELQIPVFTEENALADAAPHGRQERERKEKQDKERQAREKERRTQERQAREKRREEDRKRRQLEAEQDTKPRGDPDWPQGRQARGARDRDRDRQDRYAKSNRAYLLLSWAGGDYDYKDGMGVQDNAAEVFRLRTGATSSRGTGAGVDIKLYDAKHDAYPETSMATGLDQVDVYPFFTKRIGKGRFHIPLRVGPYYSLLSAEHNATGRYTSYNNFGLRVELEPTLDLLRRPHATLQAYATLTAGAHLSYIDDEVSRENYTSQGTILGVEPGLRLLFRNAILTASYHLNETSVRQSSRERSRSGVIRELPRVETEFKGFMFTVGFRF